MQLPEQFRSTSFRLGTLYAGLFFLSMMALLGITYLTATSEVEGIVRRSVAEDMARFQAAAASGGAQALRQAIDERSEAAAEDHFYLMTDGAGRLVTGNLPAEVWREGWSERKLGRDVVSGSEMLQRAAALNSDREVRVFAQGLEIGGFRVMAARNSHILDETQEIILAVLLWGSLVTTSLAIVGGYFVSIGPTKRVDDIALAMRDVAAGSLGRRLTVSGRRDELDRLSSDINGMLDRIESLMSSLKQVSTDIAHDLRTPLARLRQRLEGVQGRTAAAPGAGVPGDLRSAIESAVTEVDSIIETFNALLRIAQIEAGARKAKFRRIDLSALVAQIHEAFDSVAEDAGHRLDLDVRPGLWIEGDRDLLQQFLANLVENAITHVPAPGRIVLYATPLGATPIGAAPLDAAPLGEAANRVAAGVGDDGPGVPADERQRIFQRLYRLDRSRTTPGNGLGLALAAAIAELHDASIEAHDNRTESNGRTGSDDRPGLRVEAIFPALAGPTAE